ncbi:hypothetical protein KDJ21_018965 [Metabacillus litoralis]|uniref:hypothetical protein n=1 Tax=Metabacillus litoralis TaxID=152268 RepID=UPI001E44AAE6|nr:hypothetical protein [Metabacillus litoralis]UHA58891.1 hypothetical protein KDJ21_018965 [Metabacillus litoralis]
MKKEADTKELPNTAAFQDEFTRSLLDSPEEVKEGYYLFKSKTGGYSMLWPKNAVTDGPPFYQRTKIVLKKLFFMIEMKKEIIDTLLAQLIQHMVRVQLIPVLTF